MKCPYIRSRRYYDPYSGEERVSFFPCGHCAACLHNEQDSWAIRLNETAAHEPGFVYDTLTLRDDALEWVDCSDAILNGYVSLSDDLEHFLFGSGYKHQPYNDSLWDAALPYLSKSVVSDWFKRGRDACRKFHHAPCNLRYFAVLEYGPKWARPHVHLLAFGVSYEDWVRFWAKPWRRDFGFTKTKYIRKNQKNSVRSRQCISRYVSKYVNKGSWEVAPVKLGLLPRAWKCVSHGIGEEYLSSSRFDWLHTRDFSSALRERSYFEYRCYRPRVLPSGKWELHEYMNRFPIPHSSHISGFHLNSSELASVSSYVDDGGFYHKLPRYFFYKLFGYHANLLKYEVQNSILEASRLRRDKEISRIASSLASGRACEFGSSSEVVSVYRRSNYLAAVIYDTQQLHQSKMEFAWRADKLNNHYKRPLSSSKFNIILNC